MYRQPILKAWGHTAHRGWARLLLNRARDLITHGPAHRGAVTDEDDQDGHFFFNHPERGDDRAFDRRKLSHPLGFYVDVQRFHASTALRSLCESGCARLSSRYDD